MRYIELSITINDQTQSEILIAQLSDWPFESFSETETTLCAYIDEGQYSLCKSDVEAFLGEERVTFRTQAIENVNWNAVWESNFEPIPVENLCLIRAPFHQSDPSFRYEIEIMPKMSFGTGHHATTYLMVAEILESDFNGMKGLDMGSGTGVLAILAAKMGAKNIDAIDIDEWAYENCIENSAKNGVAEQITPILGDASILEGRKYNFILANINRNILISDMQAYTNSLVEGGELIVSGLLEQDIMVILQHAKSLNLLHSSTRLRDGWVSIRFRK